MSQESAMLETRCDQCGQFKSLGSNTRWKDEFFKTRCDACGTEIIGFVYLNPNRSIKIQHTGLAYLRRIYLPLEDTPAN
jgi:hypothetical protein